MEVEHKVLGLQQKSLYPVSQQQGDAQQDPTMHCPCHGKTMRLEEHHLVRTLHAMHQISSKDDEWKQVAWWAPGS